jgi:hypothetical protein
VYFFEPQNLSTVYEIATAERIAVDTPQIASVSNRNSQVIHAHRLQDSKTWLHSNQPDANHRTLFNLRHTDTSTD